MQFVHNVVNQTTNWLQKSNKLSQSLQAMGRWYVC